MFALSPTNLRSNNNCWHGVLILLLMKSVFVPAKGSELFRSAEPSQCCSGDVVQLSVDTTVIMCAIRCQKKTWCQCVTFTPLAGALRLGQCQLVAHPSTPATTSGGLLPSTLSPAAKCYLRDNYELVTSSTPDLESTTDAATDTTVAATITLADTTVDTINNAAAAAAAATTTVITTTPAITTTAAPAITTTPAATTTASATTVPPVTSTTPTSTMTPPTTTIPSTTTPPTTTTTPPTTTTTAPPTTTAGPLLDSGGNLCSQPTEELFWWKLGSVGPGQIDCTQHPRAILVGFVTSADDLGDIIYFICRHDKGVYPSYSGVWQQDKCIDDVARGAKGTNDLDSVTNFNNSDRIVLHCYPVECGWTVDYHTCETILVDQTAAPAALDSSDFGHWFICPEYGFYGIVGVIRVGTAMNAITCCLVYYS